MPQMIFLATQPPLGLYQPGLPRLPSAPSGRDSICARPRSQDRWRHPLSIGQGDATLTGQAARESSQCPQRKTDVHRAAIPGSRPVAAAAKVEPESHIPPVAATSPRSWAYPPKLRRDLGATGGGAGDKAGLRRVDGRSQPGASRRACESVVISRRLRLAARSVAKSEDRLRALGSRSAAAGRRSRSRPCHNGRKRAFARARANPHANRLRTNPLHLVVSAKRRCTRARW